jgi:polyisoprenoid-binding protein YceI
MPSYLINTFGAMVLAALATHTACADDKMPAKPVAPASAAPATAPAAGLAHFEHAPAGGSLTFNFMQAGADSRGSFKQFATQLDYDDTNLSASSLRVVVQVGSLDTQDKDRDSTLASAELLDTAKHPTATFVAKSLAKRANGGLEAVGKLTLRGVTKDLRVPFTLAPTANGYDLTGEVIIKRLDFGVGQGEWQSTEWVGDEVKLAYRVALVRGAAAAAPR